MTCLMSPSSSSVLGPCAETHAGPSSQPVGLPSVRGFDPVQRLADLMAKGQGLPPVRCAVVHPCDEQALQGAVDAAARGLIEPVLVGPQERIRSLADAARLDIGAFRLVSTAHSHDSAELSARLAAAGEVEGLMKGSLHTDELLRAVLARAGLRTGRRMSHVFRFEVPAYHKPLWVTDAAIHIAPTLSQKADIVQNAIDFVRCMGTPTPKVAILSAIETVNPDMVSTLDAAALCKMADRDQITGGLLDGPLAFDNAISAHAAQIKHIRSAVAGDADILLAPNLEAGNLLAKQLEYLAGASASGLVLGARLPIALTSRADGTDTRLASAALALVAAHQARQDPIRRAQLGH